MDFEFVNASHGDEWDILWCLDYPWEFELELHKPLEGYQFLPHQKVNHFPAIASLVTKAYMNYLNQKEKFILPSFVLPDQQKLFDKFIAKNPQKKVLEKHFSNRRIKIVNVEGLKPKKDHFYQEFMDNPFLIDGHAFDFGVFVLITSFDPIRAYRYSDDVFLRFCIEEYHPFDPKRIDGYVVRDANLHFTQMPSFAKYYEKFKFSAKSMFEDIISKKGFDVEAFWKRIDRAIATTITKAEKDVLMKIKENNFSTQNFFELVRFDIILDSELKPYIVEINMSPNMTPARKTHDENFLIFEQIIFNVVKMIGGGSHHEFWSRFDPSDVIVSNYKNLATSISSCTKNDCENNCSQIDCKLCHPCITPEIRYHLTEAIREHQNSAYFKRVFPMEDHFNDEDLFWWMTTNTQIQIKWFEAKCREDKKWC